MYKGPGEPDYASKIDLLSYFEIDIKLRGNQGLDSWNMHVQNNSCVLKIISFYEFIGGEGTNNHDDKHIITVADLGF